MSPPRGHALTAYHAPFTTTMNHNTMGYKQAAHGTGERIGLMEIGHLSVHTAAANVARHFAK